jgi:hypothetical protein
MRGLLRHLALVALLLHALIPAGWMPGAAAAPLIVCAVDGPAWHISRHTFDSRGPARNDPARDDRHGAPHGVPHSICPFAAAPHFAKSPQPLALPAPALRIAAAPRTAARRGSASHTPHRLHSPRAPPFSA